MDMVSRYIRANVDDMIPSPVAKYYSSLGIFVSICLAFFFCETASAKKIHSAQYGCIYLSSGDSIIADGKLRIIVPLKKKKLEVIEKAYTADSKVLMRIEPETVDSLLIWTPSSPWRRHTFIYIDDYGWCFEVEHGQYISVYCYAKKGYYCAGNGGIWMRGKCEMFIVKDNQIYKFGQPHKKVDKRMRAGIEALVGDDASLSEYLRTAKGRRDKILRGLVMYNPKQN